MKASDFKSEDKVLYIPSHANGDKNHVDCEQGVVSSISLHGEYVYVLYETNTGVSIRATSPHDLVKR